jgi:hypothetical protein
MMRAPTLMHSWSMLTGLFVAPMLSLLTASAHAHGGGLDADGCHTNRKTGEYHCHRGSSNAKPPSKGREASAESPRRSQVAGGPTCYTGPRGGTYTITKSGRKNYSGC